MRKKKRIITAFVMAAALGMSVPAYAEEPATGPALGAASFSQDETITKEMLEDGVLEYKEIASRIENYNVTYRNTLTTITSAVLNKDAANAMKEEAKELEEEAKEIKTSDMDEETKLLYENYKAAAKELRKQASSLSGGKLGSSYNRMLRQAKNGLTRAVQNLMITREQTAANLELMDALEQLNNTSLSITQTMNGLGMKSEGDVLASIESSLSGANNKAQLVNGVTTLNQNILNLLGWDSDEAITFAPIGEPDLSRIDAMNLEEDIKAAIGANYDLSAIRQQKAKGSTARLNKARSVNVSEQTIKIAMENLYANVISKRQAYEADALNWQAAELNHASAARKYSVGLLGNAERIGLEVQYLQAKSAHTKAALDLFKAMEDYDWAKKGMLN